MKYSVTILLKIIIVLFLLYALIGISSISFESNLDTRFPDLESWNSAKLFMQLLISGLLVGVISFSVNNNSISKLNYILIPFSIGIFLAAFVFALISPLNSWYLTVCLLSQALFLILRQLSTLVHINNPKLAYSLSLTSSLLSLLSCILLILFLFSR